MGRHPGSSERDPAYHRTLCLFDPVHVVFVWGCQHYDPHCDLPLVYFQIPAGLSPERRTADQPADDCPLWRGNGLLGESAPLYPGQPGGSSRSCLLPQRPVYSQGLLYLRHGIRLFRDAACFRLRHPHPVFRSVLRPFGFRCGLLLLCQAGQTAAPLWHSTKGNENPGHPAGKPGAGDP